MSAADESTPRVFLYRHGETDWARIGRYTGETDIPLNARGMSQVTATGALAVGPGRLIDPAKLGKIFVSPRTRARQTYELALAKRDDGAMVKGLEAAGMVAVDERLREWTYGEYEGLYTREIREVRKKKGLDGEREWDIWRDGCEGGESAGEVAARLDALIADIRALQAPHMKNGTTCDVVLFAHGHILRAFVKRWLGFDMAFNLSMMLEPGGVGVMSYQHRSIHEPAVLVGIAFPNSEKNPST